MDDPADRGDEGKGHDAVDEGCGGSVVIVDEDGAVAGEFSTATLLEDGTVRNIEYQVDGNEIVASYDSPVVEGVMPVSMQNCTPEWIMMAGAGAAAIGAAATAPLVVVASGVRHWVRDDFVFAPTALVIGCRLAFRASHGDFF